MLAPVTSPGVDEDSWRDVSGSRSSDLWGAEQEVHVSGHVQHRLQASADGGRAAVCRQSVGRQTADKQGRGPVAISGDRASDLHFLW